MESLGYIAMLLVGASVGLLGGGGSILTVPILVYLFAVPPVAATGYSLCIVGISSIFGTMHYHRSNLVDYKTAIYFAPTAFLGTFLARQVVLPHIPDVIIHLNNAPFLDKGQLIMSVFGLVMLASSRAMIRRSKPTNEDVPEGTIRGFWLSSLGLAVGFITGFVGVGGGFLIVPSLVLFTNLPMPKAVGTSLLLMATNSLFGFMGDVIAGHPIGWMFLLMLTVIASIGTLAGTYAARFVSSSQLKTAFGWMVLVMGSYVLVSQIWH